jgi:hypothetical protein
VVYHKARFVDGRIHAHDLVSPPHSWT